jgi:hypothetical protein
MLQLLLAHVPDVCKKHGFIFGSLALCYPILKHYEPNFQLILQYGEILYLTSQKMWMTVKLHSICLLFVSMGVRGKPRMYYC